MLELGERHAEERRVPLERVGFDRKVVDPRHAASLTGGFAAPGPKTRRVTRRLKLIALAALLAYAGGAAALLWHRD